jgi:hypothetical protein
MTCFISALALRRRRAVGRNPCTSSALADDDDDDDDEGDGDEG